MLNRLVYYSVRACDDGEVIRLAARAAARNESLGVTGLLIADRTVFMQILEGPRALVSQVFASIARDGRHADVIVADVSEIEALSYPKWGLALLNDREKIHAIWRRVGGDRLWEPRLLNAVQLRALFRIAMADAQRVARDAPALQVVMA